MNRNRFFRQRGNAPFQGRNALRGVKIVRRGDDNRVDLAAVEHRLEVGERRNAGKFFEMDGVGIANRAQNRARDFARSQIARVTTAHPTNTNDTNANRSIQSRIGSRIGHELHFSCSFFARRSHLSFCFLRTLFAMPRPHREVFRPSPALLPELAILGQSHNIRARVSGLPTHTHFHVFEIFYLERGEVEWWTESDSHHVAAGQIYINRPGERHGSVGAAQGPCSYFWLQIRANRPRFLPHLPAAESRTIFRVLRESAPRTFTVAPEIARYFQSLLNETRQNGPLSGVAARANLHLLLTQIARDAEAQTPSPHPSSIEKTLRFLAENLENELCPAQLAAHAGLSLGHFRERFRAETGFTPHAYLTRQRIEAAKQLLGVGESVTAIARRFGFCSSQHFATVFKKLEGVSPSDFGKNQAQQNREGGV